MAAADRRSRCHRRPSAHRRRLTAPPMMANEGGAVGQTCKGRGGTHMRPSEREQHSPRWDTRTRYASARARPIALGVALTARGVAGASGMMMGGFGQQQGAGARTGRAGEPLEQAFEQADASLRWWGRGYDGRRRGVGRAHPLEEVAR
jgi:hypothetical protein